MFKDKVDLCYRLSSRSVKERYIGRWENTGIFGSWHYDDFPRKEISLESNFQANDI